MEIEVLSAELERLFELEELKSLCHDVLGLSPADVGGSTAKGSFARALARRCMEADAVEALCDAVVAVKHHVDPRVVELRQRGFTLPEEIALGDNLGPYLVVRKLGEGRHGISYLARSGGAEVRLKVLRRDVTVDRRGLQRFLTASRLVSSGSHTGLPRGVVAGALDDETNRRFGVVHAYVDGDTLAAQLALTGPARINELRPLLRAILEPLAELHARRLAHGDLKLENVLVSADAEGTESVLLLDAGTDHLRGRVTSTNGASNRLASVASPVTAAPEQIQGIIADPRSDVYAFGVLLYQLLTGQAPFKGTAIESLVGHLVNEPDPPSFVAPRGIVGTDVDELVLRLLEKDPSRRPADARELLTLIDAVGRASAVPTRIVSDEEVQQRLQMLVASPWDEEEAAAIEATVDEGADPLVLAEGFRWVAAQLDPFGGAATDRAKKRMLSRAARLYEGGAQNPEAAEELYVMLLELDPADEATLAALERVRRRLGKHDEIIEMLLERSAQAGPGSERAHLLAEIGRIYANDAGDKEQALVAYAQAFCEDPYVSSYAEEVERLAGMRHAAWEEVLGSCMEAVSSPIATETKNLLLVRMGRWYADKVARPDLALQALSAAIANDPANDAALESMANLYRKAQQWSELGSVLLKRAEAAPPGLARDLRSEAAEVLERYLGHPQGAREIYEDILADDPGHERAAEALARLYEQTGDFRGMVVVLEKRAEALGGEDRARAMCRLAEVYELRLDDVDSATTRYRAALGYDPQSLDALRGLDRCYSKAGRYPELIEVLKRELDIAVTARQKVVLWERIGGVYEEEFLDHTKAAEACEHMLDLDPENDNALTALARHYRVLERWSDVVLVYERHLDVIPEPERRVQKALALGRALAEQLGLTDRAIEVYERALEFVPGHPEVLEGLAALRATAGDAEQALVAIEELARKAATPAAKVEQYVRAAKLLESHGDRAGAIDRYKLALEANPDDRDAALLLRRAYVAVGDAQAAVQLAERELDQTENERIKGKLLGEIARLYHDHLRNFPRAEAAARRSLTDDPTNVDAHLVLADVAFDDGRFLEASKHYEPVAAQAEAIDRARAIPLLRRFVEALSRTGSGEKALVGAGLLHQLAPEDADALMLVARITFEHGSAERSFELDWSLTHEHLERFDKSQQALLFFWLGESARRSNRLDQAIPSLERAFDLDTTAVEPLRSLAKVYEQKGHWEDVIRIMYLQLEGLEGDQRTDLLIEIGDLAASKLSDPSYAAKSYLAALADRPRDRKIMMKLMQLYSEGKDWSKLIKVILKLAEFVDDPAQKGKYIHTAAMVAAKELGDTQRAADLLDRALEFDPRSEAALNEALQMARDRADHNRVKEIYKLKIKLASETDDREALLTALHELADVYMRYLGRTDQAIAVYESAQDIDPDNQRRAELLSKLYSSDAARYQDKAVALLANMMRRDPWRPEAYKMLRQIYTDARRPDAAWCTCQALYVMSRAMPDEVRFFTRMRSEEPAPASDRLTDEDWLELLLPADADPLLTALFALIEPAVIGARAQSAEVQGYTAQHRIDPSRSHYPLIYSVHYASDVLGLEAPPVFENSNDPGGLSFLHAYTPGIVAGIYALREDLPMQACAFLAGRQLTYYRPGMYVRHLVPTGTGLKAWLFGAIKLITPGFPVSVELEGPVKEAQAALDKGIQLGARDHLARIVGKLLQQGAALDLKKWVASIDLAADRAGLVLCHDLPTTIELIRASDEASSSVSITERVKEAVLYSVSEAYFKTRTRLHIAIDS